MSGSAPHLAQLRNRARTRSAPQDKEWTAEYFSLPLSYLYYLPSERGEDRDRKLKAISAIDDDGVRRFLLHAHGLNPEAVRLLLQLAERLGVLD
ncbi:hypothetical protein [Rhodococcus qingshengii]|uniref:hypothetical protein n=1 Tax=Rhodococcus qingshengii TaxID=334542 RepID=UPI0002B7DE00|nr:hypothetical protein [Rhodococcus qingshengii]EME17602.1 hypothetical protein G418_22194 [Rhodococcus qingshengii BKS 20-40]